ncbi:MAG: hypothetical protein LUF85_16590 [Bacteroides sp.]|nr:hypothetical protein [Bacteroides sp.]
MAHRLNTNKQFMVGNGILAFAVLFVVVIFVYMSLRLSRQQDAERTFIENYIFRLEKGFTGEFISVYANDSLLFDELILEEPVVLSVRRFDEHTALLIVDKETEQVATFGLSELGGTYHFEKDENGIRLLPQ